MAQKNNALATTKDSQSANIKTPAHYIDLALLLALVALLAFAGVEGWL